MQGLRITRNTTTVTLYSTVQDVAAARDEFVKAVWTNTLPAAVTQDLRSRATATGTM
eukprot:COSAG01_NODE_7003_length_3397_cov_2.773802_1_plen_56_part_10